MNNINRKGIIEIKIVMNHTKQNNKTYFNKTKKFHLRCTMYNYLAKFETNNIYRKI